MYSAQREDRKYTFLINLNATNKFKQEFYLPIPIKDFTFVQLQANQFFAIATNFTVGGYFADFYNIDNSAKLIQGLLVASDIVKSPITNNQISTLSISVVIPTEPKDSDSFQGALIFSN